MSFYGMSCVAGGVAQCDEMPCCAPIPSEGHAITRVLVADVSAQRKLVLQAR